ncbi:hypothetical protein SERLA73DRAFT_189126 [Serpula lacrymans var. lacrymans S7.3]|uniref:Ubiquitin-like domain-containing protein n=2 Tax=Serpula lacrymans var. lacrymans TaxID=341189 RepID=F8QCW5_SERL3|nr:uncharacterized protein SERLADRAFT_479813 [Serpula lacrymans var. lacrymans S7.9]EGN93980.1 hypothetical protein SERLA73DRAFT_189126 [Serpula lacrymans var. lacrymans S7.3]EGO19343.1 hypothetical protein SERLADRAFT_479813 [Serpula lacrymans var. lacrymans S7.9]
MLSEKAKGKQRAVELGPAATLPAAEEARDLTIRFTEGIPDLVLKVSAKDTIRDVKKNIADARPQLQDRRLRLIHAGRLLTDGTLLYSWLTTLEERQNRANLGDTNNAGGAAPANSFTTWLHCSVGPIVEPGTETEEKLQTAQLQPLRGFDRLSTAGFSQEDIANFRRQFHSHSSSNFLDVDFQSEEEYDEHARALEEQWIDSMDNAGTASLSDSSSSQSLILKGIILGFFFPIIPFFFLRDEPKPAVFWEDGSEQDATESVVFSRRMQIGIMAGFVVNVLFGMWRYLLDTN